MSEREKMLEKLILSVEMGYSENWQWSKDNLDNLLTIPGFIKKVPQHILKDAGYLTVVDGVYQETELYKGIS